MSEEDKNDIINKIESSGGDNPKNDDFGDSIDGDEQDDAPTEENFIHETGIEILPKDHKQVFADAKLGVENDLDESKHSLVEACWKGYKQVGMKEKDGKQVPNCVPIDETENNMGGGLPIEEKLGIFGENSYRQIIMQKIHEMTEAPVKEPTVVPIVKPNEQPTPTRRQKPWRVDPNPNPEPKAEE